MSWKEQFKDYLIYIKDDREVIVIMGVVVMLLTGAGLFVKNYFRTPIDLKIVSVDNMIANEDTSGYGYNMVDESDLIASSKHKNAYQHKKSIQLFSFDPNTLSDDGWAKLGFSEKQINVIKKYKKHKGLFRKKEDLKNIFIISEERYQELAPYVTIAELAKTPGENNFEKNEKVFKTKAFPLIELNTADSTALTTLRSIGAFRASKIIKYRNRLGGFVSEKQLLEVYGITDSVFILNSGRITVNASTINKINLNTADATTFRKHPYINKYSIANVIVNYRTQHGKFKTIEELKEVVVITPEIYQKLKPYLTVE